MFTSFLVEIINHIQDDNVFYLGIGFGIGYADTKTVLNLSDPYGDIAYQLDLAQYGEIIDNNGIKSIEFYNYWIA